MSCPQLRSCLTINYLQKSWDPDEMEAYAIKIINELKRHLAGIDVSESLSEITGCKFTHSRHLETDKEWINLTRNYSILR